MYHPADQSILGLTFRERLGQSLWIWQAYTLLRIPNWNGYHHLRNSTLATMAFDIQKKKRENTGRQWGWVQAIICQNGTRSIHRREIVKRTTDVLLY